MSLRLPVLAVVATIAGPILFLRSFRELRKRRLMLDTPTARIRSMPMGLVEIHGEVEPRSVLTGPFSGHPCAYWEVEIATRGRRGGWQTVHRNASGHPFFVRDDTGIAMVYPHGSECHIPYAETEECGGLDVPECYDAYMKEQRLALREMWKLGAMRFRERTLEQGQGVFVLGTAVPRARARAISDDGELAATGTDDPAARRLTTLDEQVVAVVRQGERETTFLVSQESERALALELGARAWAGLVGGPLLALLGLATWLFLMGSRVAR